MKAKNLHLQYSEKDDRVLLVDHGNQPLLAYDVHAEFLYCVAAWGFAKSVRSVVAPKNIIDKVLRKIGIRLIDSKETREITTKRGTFRVTVEHLK